MIGVEKHTWTIILRTVVVSLSASIFKMIRGVCPINVMTQINRDVNI